MMGILQGYVLCLVMCTLIRELKSSPPVVAPVLSVSVHPKKTKVTDHGIVSFYCQTGPNPTPHMYWRRNGRMINIRGPYEFYRTWGGAVLRINHVRHRRDNARFECVAYDDVNPPVSAAAHLMVYLKGHIPEGFPQIVLHPTLRVVPENFYCVIQCAVAGDPEPTVSWIKDFVPVDLTDYRFSLLEGANLQIMYLNDMDEGTYECVAQNVHGLVISEQARLIVVDP